MRVRGSSTITKWSLVSQGASVLSDCFQMSLLDGKLLLMTPVDPAFLLVPILQSIQPVTTPFCASESKLTISRGRDHPFNSDRLSISSRMLRPSFLSHPTKMTTLLARIKISKHFPSFPSSKLLCEEFANIKVKPVTTFLFHRLKFLGGTKIYPKSSLCSDSPSRNW